MRIRICSCLLALLLSVSAHAAVPDVGVRDGRAVAMLDGKAIALSEEEFPLQPVRNAALRFMTVGEDQAKKNLPVGLYLFDAKGALTAFLDNPAAEFCSAVSLSPDGKRLAMDSGTFLIRSWNFYAYPEMKPLPNGSVSYLSGEDAVDLIWADNDNVLFTAPTETARQCEYDPCEAHSVVRHTLSTGKSATLLAATDLCNYTLRSFADGKVTADKLCLPNLDAWKSYPENAPVEQITVAP